MQKQRLILIIGIVLGVIAVFLVKVYLDQQRSILEQQAKNRMQKVQESTVPVLVAKKDIPKDSPIEAENLEVQMTPKQFVQPQAVGSVERINGMSTIVPIAKGEQVTLSKLVWPKQTSSSGAAAGSLAMVTPVGKRAITISVDNISSLAGMIKAGDYVDVIGLIPVPVNTPDKKQSVQVAVAPLFQNVLVLAVGREIGRPSASALPEVGRYSKAAEASKTESSSGSNSGQLITLALNPQEANLIAFVQEQGKIRLTLRSPADSQVQPAVPTTWDTLFKYIMPNAESTGAETKEATVKAPPTEYVEIYRGLRRERIPLSK